MMSLHQSNSFNEAQLNLDVFSLPSDSIETGNTLMPVFDNINSSTQPEYTTTNLEINHSSGNEFKMNMQTEDHSIAVNSVFPSKNPEKPLDHIAEQNVIVENRLAKFIAEKRVDEENLEATAKKYLNDMIASHKKGVEERKRVNRANQMEETARISQLKEGGAIWEEVTSLIDLNKPNPFSKSTEKMREMYYRKASQKMG